MDSQEFYDTYPDPGSSRDKLVLDAISNNLIVVNYVPITSSINNHTATFYVCDDTARVELPDNSRFRFQVSAKMSQQCADALEASMVTAKIMDLRYQQSNTVVDATIFSANALMSEAIYSKQYNTKVEEKRNGSTLLFSDVGKAWILDNKLSSSAGAINYGFYDKNALYTNLVGLKLWQNVGSRHNALYEDYSQTLYLMQKKCQVDGEDTDIISVMQDPELAPLINYGGVLHYTRQP